MTVSALASTSSPVSPDKDRLTVVLVLSLAYSGSTWFTLVAGSHEEAVCLGAGNRILECGSDAAEKLCVVHGGACRYWPSFFDRYDPSENFFVQLAAHTGKRVFVINNPSRSMIEEQMRHPMIDLKPVCLMRNGPAVLASAMRHNPGRVDNVYQASLAWLFRGTKNLERRIGDIGGEVLLQRLEDAVADPSGMLAALSSHVGIDYDDRSLRFWEFEHHLATGNSGVLDLLVRMQGGRGFVDQAEAYYEDLLAHLRKAQGIPKLDESWKKVYDPVDLAAYDFVAGSLYEKYGYARPNIDAKAQKDFVVRYCPPETPEDAVKMVGPWRREAGNIEAIAASAAGKQVQGWVSRGPQWIQRPLRRVYRRFVGR